MPLLEIRADAVVDHVGADYEMLGIGASKCDELTQPIQINENDVIIAFDKDIIGVTRCVPSVVLVE